MTEQLYRLPLSGDWILLSHVTSIRMFQRHDNDNWYVVVVTHEGGHYEIACSNKWVAEETRSEIACEANHAKLAVKND